MIVTLPLPLSLSLSDTVLVSDCKCWSLLMLCSFFKKRIFNIVFIFNRITFEYNCKEDNQANNNGENLFLPFNAFEFPLLS